MNQSNAGSESFPYYYYDYPDWYSNPEPTKPPKEVILPCDPTADDKLFHICMLSVSFVIMLVLAVLTRKNKLCQGFSRGSSSIFSPVNFLDQTQQKGLVMAVYGLMFSKLAVLMISPDPLPFFKDTPASIKEYMKIIGIFYYPVLYYPLLVCGTLQNSAGYVFGSLLSFTHFGVLVWQKFDCPKTPEIYKYYALLAAQPQLACLAYLCVQFPVLFVKGPETDEDLDSSYYTEYVKSLLKKKSSTVSSSAADTPAVLERILEVAKSYIYRPERVFRFPLKLAVSSLVACLAIYHVRLWAKESNLKGLYKGDAYRIYNSQKTICPSKSGVVCWMGLTGYQAATVCLGMAIQTLVFFICFLFLVFIIIIPVFHGRNLIVFEVVGKSWPAWVMIILVSVLQHVTSKLFFISKEADTTDLNNRETLFLLTYLLFVVNIVVGLIVAIWRIVITALYNIIHFGRIDVSLLHRTAESYDPAFYYYTHFLKVEVSQTHPVLKAFCGLLLDMMIELRAGQKKDPEEVSLQIDTKRIQC
ncbi:receptor for retinol uptake stra6-like [Nematolebias whitei]|uniref:receptor for retinol uptake stra6-like n=1 Tax=Nematolebias whitei TaxID=451745 RepID=UPI00189A57C7|nr:receptor for retinol uptake stra6-like [Nematolebias whitei]